MKVKIPKDLMCGNVEVAAGEYMVALSGETGQLVLTGRGTQCKIPAVRRRSTSKSRVTTVTFFSGGGSTWSLVMTTPKQGEWVSMLEVSNGKK